MVDVARDLEWLIDEQYVPSWIERKKWVLMYFFVGVVIALSKWILSVYEYFHLRQAIGWWMTFFVCLIVSSPFFFFPWLRIMPVILFVFFIVIWLLFVKQAWEWGYVVNNDKIFFPLFVSLGSWVVSIFEIEVVSPEILES